MSHCTGCSCEIAPGQEAAHEKSCPGTKGPSARELAERLGAIEQGFAAFANSVRERLEALERELTFLSGYAAPRSENHENTPRSEADVLTGGVLGGRVESVPADSAYKLTDEEREDLFAFTMSVKTGATARGDRLPTVAWISISQFVESLVTREVRRERERVAAMLKERAGDEGTSENLHTQDVLLSAADAIEHGGGATKSSERSLSGGGFDSHTAESAASTPPPAASGVPERPDLEVPWTMDAVRDMAVGSVVVHGERERKYALALESLHAATEAKLAEAHADIEVFRRDLREANDERDKVYADRDALRTQLADMARAADAVDVALQGYVFGRAADAALRRLASASRAGGKDTNTFRETQGGEASGG